MRKITIIENVSLDGVMQAPASPTEDQRNGFDRGGWAVPYGDEVQAREMSQGFGTVELLFGRRTYQNFFDFWPKQTDPNPFTDVLNRTTKYVTSRTVSEPLPWENSVLLSADAAESVAALKHQPGSDLVVLGSGDLAQTLLSEGLVETLILMVHPLILGSGTRLLRDGSRACDLELTRSVTTTTGVIISTYAVSSSSVS